MTRYGVWAGDRWVAGPLSFNAVRGWWHRHPECHEYTIAAIGEDGSPVPLTTEQAEAFDDEHQSAPRPGRGE